MKSDDATPNEQFDLLADLEQTLSGLHRRPRPRSAKEFREMQTPIARRSVEGGHCIMMGKIFDWSPLYFSVAYLFKDEVITRRVRKDTVHLEPCQRCTDFDKTSAR